MERERNGDREEKKNMRAGAGVAVLFFKKSALTLLILFFLFVIF